jgi:iron complex outermembrane receptor protein
LRTSGFDLDARYRARFGWGNVNVGITGTYVKDYKVQQFEAIVSGPGSGFTGAIPRWRHFASIDANSGPWGATLAQTFQRGYNEVDRLTCPGGFPAPECTGTRRVGSLEIYDLQGRYTGWPGLTLTLGVRNLFDRAPPRALTPQTFQIGYDASYADPRGQTFYVAARYAFR